MPELEKRKPLEIFYSLSPNCNFVLLHRGALYFSYNTLIAYYDKRLNTLYINDTKYSNTTNEHMNRIEYIYKSLNVAIKDFPLEQFTTLMKCIDILPFGLEDLIKVK